MHKYCFEALDQTLRDILRFKDTSSADKPFGGKTVVFGGDFRQILPVIAKGSRQDIVNATLNSSYLWAHCEVLNLTKNMRLQRDQLDADLDEIGSSIDGIEKVQIPNDLLINNCDDPISAIVESTYPYFFNHSSDIDYLQQRAILAPTLDMVESINEYMVSLNHSPEKTYLSFDTVCMSDHSFSALEHVGVPMMLLRNIDQSSGLCNGTRLIITRLENRVIEAKVLSGNMAGQKVFIPRMTLTPSDARIPFKFQRRQFPIVVSFAMTTNKSQGQSLSHVGLFLKKPVFTYGQLYVALSRVTSRKGLKILVYDDDGQITNEARNVVYKEVFPIGDGRIGSSIDGIEKVQIPNDLLINNCDDPISAIVESTYPYFFNHSSDIDYLQQRAILAPTLDMVESINEYMISLNHSPQKTYLSSDTVCMSDHSFSALEHVHTPEFLNSIKCSGIPNHSITLKVGVPVMLLRNIDQSSGLCNGTRLIITRLENRVIEAKVLSGNMAGQKVFIPRMTLTPSDARIPFKFQRRQFPIVVSFAMTTNKSQGQSLSHVGLFLKKPVFTYGQLYVALSRVTSRKGLKILVYDDDGQITNEARNVVHDGIIRYLQEIKQLKKWYNF
ncbi:hypothetical protein A4A49_52816 [Nicotiana attenuata]|uniref:ATP-dependent DNA helicase n=1 Tax=Nicotiana attenuata TaxID=49451 RepID=A0A314KMW6_NICAT|nr:hypothetical protein A4A49_52816 [Nicotiana attenuata]